MRFIQLGKAEWEWIQDRARCILCEDTTGFLMVDDEGQPTAGVAFDSWAPNSCLVHLAIDNPMALRHGLLEEAMAYAFSQRGVDLMIGMVPANNEKALKLNKHIGFEEVFRIESGYDKGIDYVMMHMRSDECKWLTNGR